MTSYVRVLETGAWAREGDAVAHLLDAAPWAGGRETGAELRLEGTRLDVPVVPTKIVCIGKNYRAHAEEMKSEVPKEPLLFFKPPSSLLASGGTVLLPPESEQVDYEGELAVVVGKRGRRIAPSDALAHVFGCLPACDVTARDLQKRDGQWTRAKGFDGFCPVGSRVVTGIDPSALAIHTRVNGELRQDGSTRDMVRGVAELIAYISGAMTLEPGDLVLTGTPHGVGPLSPGDRVTVEVEAVGSVDFRVDAERV